MIAKDTTITVNFFVTDDTLGLPATGQASNITANISINGGTATAIADTITEKGSGWYKFNHLFSTAGNAFITFSATGCIIMPWEDDVVAITGGGGGSGPSAADIADAVWDEIIFGRSPWVVDSAADILLTAAATGTPASIWNYANRSLTSEVLTRDENYQPIKTLAISSEITTAKDAILTRGNSAWTTATGFSTFNPSTDTVTINSTQAATMATATGFATPSDLAGLSTFDPSNDTVTINATQAATMTTATGFATPSDLAGLSTFNAATDAVTINSTQAATMATATGFATPSDIPTSDITAIKTKVNTLHNTDLTGIATSANVTSAQNAVIAAMPTIPTDYAKASDLTGLSTFNAATDAVTVNSAQAATMVTATGFATPTNITTAQAAIIAHGDENWVGGGSGGGATAQQIWEYSNRTLTASPTDVSSLATKTDLTTAVAGLSTFNANTDKVTIKAAQEEDIIAGVWGYMLYLQNVGYTAGTILAGTMGFPNVILNATDTITTYGDNNWTTAVVPTNDITYIKNKVDTLHNTDLTGIATSTDITNAQTAIVNAVPAAVWGDKQVYANNTKGDKLVQAAFDVHDLPTKVWFADLSSYDISNTAGYQVYTGLSNCATGTDMSVLAEILKDLNAGVLNWSVTANALTIYNDNNTVRGTYTLTRDADGNITRILPNS